MTDSKQFVHSFDVAAWLQDQIEDGCIEVPAGEEEAMANFIFLNFDFTDVWDQLDVLANYYQNN